MKVKRKRATVLNEMKRLDRFHWILLATIAVMLAFNTYLVMTPYRYFHLEQALVRVNRFTGEAERLVSSGWKPMAPRRVLEEQPSR
jgi:hypothetical protein